MVKARLSRDRPAFKRADSCVAASLTARTERYTSTPVHARTVGPQTTLRAVPPSRLQRLAAVAWQQVATEPWGYVLAAQRPTGQELEGFWLSGPACRHAAGRIGKVIVARAGNLLQLLIPGYGR